MTRDAKGFYFTMIPLDSTDDLFRAYNLLYKNI